MKNTAQEQYSDIFDKLHGLVGMDRRSMAYIKIRSKIENDEYEAECRAEALAS
jgi:hypothetical protein